MERDQPNITRDMEKAGVQALDAFRGIIDDFSLVREVYKAMRAAPPQCQQANPENPAAGYGPDPALSSIFRKVNGS